MGMITLRTAFRPVSRVLAGLAILAATLVCSGRAARADDDLPWVQVDRVMRRHPTSAVALAAEQPSGLRERLHRYALGAARGVADAGRGVPEGAWAGAGEEGSPARIAFLAALLSGREVLRPSVPLVLLHEAIGLWAHGAGEGVAAVRLMWRAAQVADAIGWWEAAARCGGRAGEWAIESGDFVLARRALEARARWVEALGRTDALPGALNDAAVACGYVSDFRAAADAWDRAERLMTSGGNEYLRGVILGNLAGVNTSLGNYAVAERQLARGRSLLAALSASSPGVPNEANLLVARATLEFVGGNLLLGEGRPKDASEPFRAAADLAVRGGEDSLRLACEANLTIVLSELGLRREAIPRWRALLEDFGRHGRSSQWALACGNLADVLRREGAHEEALARYQDAIRAAGDDSGPQLAVDLEGDSALVLTEMGLHDRAIELHLKALDRARTLDYGAGVLYQWIGLCKAWLAKGDLDQAIACARSGFENAEARLAGLADESTVGARARMGDLFTAALLAASRKGDPAVAFEFLRASRGAGLWRALSSVPVADPAVEKATEEEARLRAAEAAAWKELYAAIVDEKVPDARVQALRTAAADAERKARETAERNEAARASARTPVAGPSETLADAAKALPDDTALVAYAASGADAFALVVTRASGGRIVPLRPRKEDAGRELATGIPSVADLAYQADRLVVPLGLPASIRRVLVSPSAATQGVPFPAIFGERQVVMVPFVGRGPAEVAAPSKEALGRVVAFVDPVADAAPLEGARAEGRAIAREVIEGKDATESAARAWLSGAHGGFDAILFGCHARVDASDPYRSHLVLAADGTEDGRLGARELLGMRIVSGVRLVALSACESAVGKTFEGEGLIGLHRAFLLAGAPRVLASLWKVDDAATARFMTAFFQAWNPRDPASGKPTGKGVAAEEALRLAQKAVREDPTNGTWKDPQFWAAWVLWGPPR